MILVLHYYTLYDHCSLFCFVFFFPLFLGFALHNIHAFHSRLFLFIFFKFKKKKGRKRKQIVFCTIFLALKTWLINLFSHNMSFVPCLALMSLLITPYKLKLCSACCVGKMFMVLITLS